MREQNELKFKNPMLFQNKVFIYVIEVFGGNERNNRGIELVYICIWQIDHREKVKV